MTLTTITGANAGANNILAGNTLLVTATGVVAADGPLRGIILGQGAKLVNHGTIFADAVAVGAGGTNQATTGQFITNHGTIQSVSASALRWANGVASNVNLLNFGEISTIGPARAAISMDAGGNTITNHGTITSSTGVAIDILVGQAGRGSTITNTGLIATGKAAGIAIDLDTGADTVVNAGRILGNVALRGGADIYDGRGGHVTGTVAGGTGNDVYRLDSAAGRTAWKSA
jgi:hypothetical protein